MAFETFVFSQCPLNQYPIEVPPYTIELTFGVCQGSFRLFQAVFQWFEALQGIDFSGF